MKWNLKTGILAIGLSVTVGVGGFTVFAAQSVGAANSAEVAAEEPAISAQADEQLPGVPGQGVRGGRTRGSLGFDPSAMTEEQKAEWEARHADMEAKRGGMPDLSEMTEEQKAEFEAKRTEMESKRTNLPEMTEEQKAEIEAKRAEMESKRAEQEEKARLRQETWDAMSAEQKEELYRLAEQQIAIQIQQIDKYLELGLIDAEVAAMMKEQLNTSAAAMRAEGKLPGIGFGFGFGGGGIGFGIDGGRSTERNQDGAIFSKGGMPGMKERGSARLHRGEDAEPNAAAPVVPTTPPTPNTSVSPVVKL